MTLTPYGYVKTLLGDPVEDTGAVFSVAIRASDTQWTAANLVNPFSYSLIGLCAGAFILSLAIFGLHHVQRIEKFFSKEKLMWI